VLDNSSTLVKVSSQINPKHCETLSLQGFGGKASRLPKPAGARQQAHDYSWDAAVWQQL
jgi:hypothetical protein